MELTQARVRELFDYRDGLLYWRVKPSKDTCVGDLAGSERRDGYRIIRYQRRGHLAHRLIYLMHHGALPRFVDHIDCDPRNNRIENLRAATHSQNHMNRTKQANNTSGYKGVSWINKFQKYQAKIKANGRHISLGCFDDPRDAHAAYVEACKKYYGDFGRTA